MPTIPTSPGQQVAPGATPAPAIPDTGGIGTGVGNLGDAITNIVLKERDKADAAAISNAERRVIQRSTDELQGTKEQRGLLRMTQEGLFQAQEARAKGFSQYVEEELAGLNGRQRDKANAAFARHELSFNQQLQRHVGIERVKFEHASLEAYNVELIRSTAIAAAGSGLPIRADGTFDTELVDGTVQQAMLKFAEFADNNPGILEVPRSQFLADAEREFRAELHEANIGQLQAEGKDRLAAAYFDVYGDELDLDERESVLKSVRTSSALGGAERLGEGLARSAEPAFRRGLGGAARSEAFREINSSLATEKERDAAKGVFDARQREREAAQLAVIQDYAAGVTESMRLGAMLASAASVEKKDPELYAAAKAQIADFELMLEATRKQAMGLGIDAEALELYDNVLRELSSNDPELRQKGIGRDLGTLGPLLRSMPGGDALTEDLLRMQGDLVTTDLSVEEAWNAFEKEQFPLPVGAAGKKEVEAVRASFRRGLQSLLLSERHDKGRALSGKEVSDILREFQDEIIVNDVNSGLFDPSRVRLSDIDGVLDHGEALVAYRQLAQNGGEVSESAIILQIALNHAGQDLSGILDAAALAAARADAEAAGAEADPRFLGFPLVLRLEEQDAFALEGRRRRIAARQQALGVPLSGGPAFGIGPLRPFVPPPGSRDLLRLIGPVPGDSDFVGPTEP